MNVHTIDRLRARAATLHLAVCAELSLGQLQARIEDLHGQVVATQERARAESRDLTDAETEAATDQLAEIKRLQARAKLLRDTDAAGAEIYGGGRTYTPPAGPTPMRASSSERGEPEIRGVTPGADPSDGARPVRASLRNVSARGSGGFRNLGEFALSVRGAALHGPSDARLIRAAASTFGSEGIGADGGFAVPPDYRATIQNKIAEESPFLDLCDQVPTPSNSVTMPTGEESPWSTSGIAAVWTAEGTALTQSKPALKSVSVPLHKLAVLVPVTDEMLEDGPGLSAYLARIAAAKLSFALANAVLTGDGVGKPLGIHTSNAALTIAKESGQAASTLLAQNVYKMRSRAFITDPARAAWIINHDVRPVLFGLSDVAKNVAGTENVGGWPLFTPAGGIGNSPVDRLLGLPIFYSQAAKSLSAAGDITLADFGHYMLAMRESGIRADFSMHVFFDQNASAFRFTMRVGGQPWLQKPIAPLNGSNTLSPFVLLGAR